MGWSKAPGRPWRVATKKCLGGASSETRSSNAFEPFFGRSPSVFQVFRARTCGFSRFLIGVLRFQVG